MSTNVTYTQQFPGSPEAVWQMLTDPEYIHTKGMRSGSLEVSGDVEVQGDETVIISRRKLPAKMPGFMKKFVGEVLIINETQKWGPAAADGARAGSFVVDFGGQPMAFHGDLTLRASAKGCEVTTAGPLKSSVPFAGGKAESVAKEWTVKYLVKEEEVAADWLADKP